MKWKLLTVGRPALPYARSGADEYLGRLRRCVGIDWQAVRQLPAEKPSGAWWLVLDERGVSLDTTQFRARVDAWEMAAIKQITVMVGGTEGHTEETRRSADFLLALGPFTLQHELALVVFLEQLYRVYTMKRGEPYHR